MARDLDPILDSLDILREELETDWDEFTESKANLKRHSISYWRGFTKSIVASGKNPTINVKIQFKDVEDMFGRLRNIGNGIKYHDPLPAYYHKEEKHFKKKYSNLISHIDKVKRAIIKKKKSHLENVQVKLNNLVNEIKRLQKDEEKFFNKITRARNKKLTRKSEIKEFLGEEFNNFWSAAKPHFSSHIIGNQGLFIYKGYYQGDKVLTITAILKKRKNIYKKFLDATTKLSKVAKKEVKYTK